ncbi:MAG: insulinase family protein [Gammaproteobacteria bacterium]|nr:insulinase family protein [Gammaproteobacteria bacterium]
MPRTLHLFRPAMFLLACLSSSVFAATSPAVLRATLGNGLRVVIVKNTLAPVVTTEMNYLVGSNEAPAGFPGTAHALEHMMFRGSPGLSKDQLAEISAYMGGRFDADTQDTVTQYFFTVPADDLDVALHIAAIRMRGLDLSQKEWEKERGAIEQEVSRDLSNPQYLMFKQLQAVLFKGTPYAHDALGTRPSFDKTTSAMLRKFYETWYAPNNAILVIVGDVDPKAVLSRVKSLFAGIPAKPLPARAAVKFAPVQPQTLHLPTDTPYGFTAITFRLPGYHSADYAAAEILGDVLASQRGSLYALVPENKALYASFLGDTMPDTGLGIAFGVFPKGGDSKLLTAEISQVLAGIAKQGVSPDLVAAAKRQEITQLEFQKNSVAGLAQAWSQALAVQGLTSPDDMIAAYREVTVADVNRVARVYLNQAHAFTAILTPEYSGKPLAAKGYGGAESFNSTPEKSVPLPGWAQSAISRLNLPRRTLDPVVSVLPNGLKLIVQTTDVSDTVSVYGHLKSQPALQQPKGQDGVADVLDGLFSYGTTSLNRLAYQKALDDIAAQEAAGTDFAVQAPAANFARAVQLLADNELHPALPARYFPVVQNQTARFQAGQLQSPDYLFHRATTEALVPAGDPTLREATPQSIMGVTLADVRSYYQQAFRPDLATIVVIGKVTPARARSVIEKYFGGWRATGAKPVTDLPPVPLSKPGPRTVVPDKTSLQDTVVLGETLGLNLFSPERYALQLGNLVLGRGFYASRLGRDLREKRGLVYSIGSDFKFTPTRGIFTVEYGCDPDKVTEARNLIVRDLAGMQNTQVTAVELDRAKAMNLRAIPLKQASVDEIAGNWLTFATDGLPLDELRVEARHYIKLTAPEIQAAYKHWLRPADLAEVVKGPPPH